MIEWRKKVFEMNNIRYNTISSSCLLDLSGKLSASRAILASIALDVMAELSRKGNASKVKFLQSIKYPVIIWVGVALISS